MLLCAVFSERTASWLLEASLGIAKSRRRCSEPSHFPAQTTGGSVAVVGADAVAVVVTVAVAVVVAVTVVGDVVAGQEPTHVLVIFQQF